MFAAINGCDAAVVMTGPVALGTGIVTRCGWVCAVAVAAIIPVRAIPAINVFIIVFSSATLIQRIKDVTAKIGTWGQTPCSDFRRRCSQGGLRVDSSPKREAC